MATKAQEITSNEIGDRLNKIAFHFEERDKFRADLTQFSGSDCDPTASNHGELERAIVRIQSEELNILSELFHLHDNVTKYFQVHGLKTSELGVIDNFKPYRVAANYVNTQKHGTRGRNQTSAKLDYHALVYERATAVPSPADKLLDVRSLINFEGKLLESADVIECLIRIWEMFLRHHTEVDVAPFVSRIGAVLARRQGGSVYSARLPDGVIADAKARAIERKHVHI